MKNIFLILLLANLINPLKAQKVSNPLKQHEIKLLNFLLADTIHNTCFRVNNNFGFGLSNSLFTNSNIIKNGKNVYVQPLGTGRLYKAVKQNGTTFLERIDLTTHSGSNFYAQNFFIKDTLYQMGGLGFWQIRGILTYFSNETKQWELVQANKSIPTYFEDQKDAAIHFNDNRVDPKIYVTNSYYYPNYPYSFDIASTDSCYEYDINTRTWNTLGKLNPEFKKIFANKHSHEMELHINGLYIYQSQLEFNWVNFDNNTFGKFKVQENNKLRDLWLSNYNADKRGLESNFQFNLGNDLYFMKLQNSDSLIWTKTSLQLNQLDETTAIPIYSNTISFGDTLYAFYVKNKTSIYTGIFLLTIIGLGSRFLKRKKMPKELTTLLYQNFFNAINIVEKELLEILYESNLKGEEVSTKTINKIIGVQQKDTLTQNKSRSDHFIKINQKFKMATQNTEPLIVKNRDKVDKRQYNYGLNNLYITEIGKLLKE